MNGRTTCDKIEVQFAYTSPNITFNGTNIPKQSTINLSWTDSTITLGDVTITA